MPESLTDDEQAKIPPDLRAEIGRLRADIGETRFDNGLDRLGYDNGWYDIFEDQSLVASQTGLSGFAGGVTPSGDYGSLTTTVQNFGFVPSEVAIGQDADVGADVTPTDGTAFEYDADTPSAVELAFTGSTATETQSQSETGLANGDTFTTTVGGTESTDVTAELSVSGAGDGTQLWSNNTPVTTNIVSGGGAVFVDDDGSPALTAYDPSDGSTKWNLPDAGYFDELAAGEGLVFAAGSLSVTAFDQSDGSEVWNISESAEMMVHSNGTLYIALPDGGLQSRSASDGTLNWSYQYSGDVVQDVAESSNGYVAAATAGDEHYVVTTSGTFVYDFGVSFGLDTIVAAQEDFIFPHDRGADLKSLDSTSNTQNWSTYMLGGGSFTLYQTDVGGVPKVMAVGFSGEEPDLILVDAETGSIEWSVRSSGTGRPVASTLSNDCVLYVDGTLYDPEYNVYSLRLDDGSQKWTTTVSVGEIGGFAYSNGSLVIGGANGVTALEQLAATQSPSVALGGNSITTGSIVEGETYTETITLSPSSYTAEVSLSGALVSADLAWTEITKPVDPQVTIDSETGTQAVSYAGTPADGETVDVSGQVDPALIDGVTTVTLNVAQGVTPVGEVGVTYRHEGIDAGGIVNYEIEDADGNVVPLTPGETVETAELTAAAVQLNIEAANGFSTAALEDYAVYLQR